MYTCIPSPGLPAIPPLWVITEHRAGLPLPYGSFPLTICFTCGSTYPRFIFAMFLYNFSAFYSHLRGWERK